MNRYQVAVEPLSGEQMAEPGGAYDVFVATLGFEKRARFIPGLLSGLAERKVAPGFTSRKVLDYEKNWEWFKASGFDVEEVSDAEFAQWCRELVRSTRNRRAKRSLRMGVDVSSMSRLRMAALIHAAAEAASERIDVDFLYAPAEFAPPPDQSPPIAISEPVISAFAGWSSEPERASMAIFGLGYEADKALGALEFLEPIGVWAFRPEGEDVRYDSAVEASNESFWGLLPPQNVIRYRIDDPYDCFVRLESLVHGATRTGRPILIPFGPKIFSVSCLLVAVVHYPSVVVWRVSSGEFEPAQNRAANGKIVGLRSIFLKR